MTLYAPVVLGRPSWLSQRVCRYDTAISTLTGTSNSRAALSNPACSSVPGAAATASEEPRRPGDATARVPAVVATASAEAMP